MCVLKFYVYNVRGLPLCSMRLFIYNDDSYSYFYLESTNYYTSNFWIIIIFS